MTVSAPEMEWIEQTNAAIRRINSRLPNPIEFEVGHDQWLIMQDIQPEVAAVVFGYWRGTPMGARGR